MEHYQQIVETLEATRSERGIPKAELARRAKVDNRRLMFALCGKRQMRVDEFVRVCIVLEMPMSAFEEYGTSNTLTSFDKTASKKLGARKAPDCEYLIG
ncbi:MAG: transcriptional regulator [Eggerthellaceae bacterium]|nr:transcriptional regulator [Eggerthellaceae bacterium]MBQ9044178.1 transcriptional regulator [Eggerthellaceae bacterium]